MEGFLHYKFGGLIFEGAYFRNFTVPYYRKLTMHVDKLRKKNLPHTK